MAGKTYIAIDLKSFYASVECVDRGLDPLTARLVVADASRTEKTICLAVSPAVKAYGVSGRARLFEVVQKSKQCGFDFIAAPPRMALYMETSAKIFDIYLRYVSKEDVHVYSVDEVFIDVTSYLKIYNMSAKELAYKMIKDVLDETGITATAGIGTNMYLCKIAMDIVAKHMEADEKGVRIAEIDENSYRELLWDHTPITDFWRVGKGIAKRLKEVGIFTMGDIARCSLGSENDFYNEDLLYKLFGINAELLIDHAWGYEPVEIKDIKSYKPEVNSISSGQVLTHPYTSDKARLVLREMADMLSLDLVKKGVMTDQMVINIGFDIDNLTDPEIMKRYKGEIVIDGYGRKIPRGVHGSINLPKYTSSTRIIIDAVMDLYDRIVDPILLVRRMNVVACRVKYEEDVKKETEQFEQMDMFSDFGLSNDDSSLDENVISTNLEESIEKEKKIQDALLKIKDRYGKNAVLKGMNFEEGATARERNSQIGGHKA